MDIKSYYIDLYGLPDRTARFVSRTGKTIYVYKFGASRNREEVAIYATDGARDIRSGMVSSQEFFIGIRPEVDDIAEAIAETALEGIGSALSPSIGDTTTLSEPLWAGTNMSTFMFSDGSEIIPALKVGHETVNFIKLVPLYASELALKKSHGEQALWEHFRRGIVEYWNADRGPAL